MTLQEDIYDFLHDPRQNRWAPAVVDNQIAKAKLYLTDKAEAFLRLRTLKREQAKLKRLTYTTKTIDIPLLEDTSTYTIDDDDFVSVQSVIYNDCMLSHGYSNCTDTCAATADNPIRGYTSEGLKKGTIKVFPVPKKRMKVCDIIGSVSKLKPEYKDYVCPDIKEDTDTYEVETSCGVMVEVLDDYSQFGWGFLNKVKPTKSLVCKVDDTKVDDTKVDDTKVDDTIIEFNLGSLTVTYKAKDYPTFPDNDEELLQELLSSDDIIKHFVCGHLLRDDRDSHSRSLGNEELALLENRIELIFAKYEDLYETDNILDLKAQEAGAGDEQLKRAEVDDRLGKLDLNKEARELDKESITVQYGNLRKSKLQTDEDLKKLGQRTCKNRFETLDYRSV